MSRVRLAIIIGVGTALLGIIDLLLVCLTIPWRDGLLAAAHDPGKQAFHLILLPFASFYLTLKFPLEVLRSAWVRYRVVVGGLGIFLFLLAALFAYDDAQKWFCERRPSPADVRQEVFRDKLLQVVRKWQETLGTSLEPAEFSKVSRDLKDSYDATVKELRGTRCDLFEKSSVRSKWAGVLTFAGIVFLAVVLGVLAVYALLRKSLDQKFLDVLIVIAALLIPWFLLRAYSEWYINFGAFSIKSYRPMVPALVLAVVIMFLIYFLQKRRRALVIASTLFGAVSTGVSLLADLHPEWFYWLAEHFAVLDPVQLASVYSLLLISVALVVWNVIEPPDQT